MVISSMLACQLAGLQADGNITRNVQLIIRNL
jgi:hypothetical protein